MKDCRIQIRVVSIAIIRSPILSAEKAMNHASRIEAKASCSRRRSLCPRNRAEPVPRSEESHFCQAKQRCRRWCEGRHTGLNFDSPMLHDFLLAEVDRAPLQQKRRTTLPNRDLFRVAKRRKRIRFSRFVFSHFTAEFFGFDALRTNNTACRTTSTVSVFDDDRNEYACMGEMLKTRNISLLFLPLWCPSVNPLRGHPYQ
jgi:hypothetical protein